MRFSLKHHGQLSCVEHCPEGEYVLHSDYARLKAEVERLTKAGDAMADYLFDAPYPCRIFYHKWKDAKEGKGQS